VNTNQVILLVEDDSNDVLLLQRAFRRAGLNHALQVVSDGDQAVSYLAGDGDYSDRTKHPLPALILLDLKLPRRSGLEVLEWLRGQPAEIKALPVIVLTSSRLSEDVDRAYGLGANSYMAKPSGNYDGLAEMVKNLGKKTLEKT
jgi:CheY-like chemotaxis protein